MIAHSYQYKTKSIFMGKMNADSVLAYLPIGIRSGIPFSHRMFNKFVSSRKKMVLTCGNPILAYPVPLT